MKKNIEELTLLLMYLTSWDEDGYVADDDGNPQKNHVKTCWKGYSFDAINSLMDDEYLYFSKYKNKTVTLTPKGEELARALAQKYIKQ